MVRRPVTLVFGALLVLAGLGTLLWGRTTPELASALWIAWGLFLVASAVRRRRHGE